MCITGKGIGPGVEGLAGQVQQHAESLPMLYSSTGRSKAAAVSRKTQMASASRASSTTSATSFGPGGPALGRTPRGEARCGVVDIP